MKTQRILAIILALVMVSALSFSAFAEGNLQENGKQFERMGRMNDQRQPGKNGEFNGQQPPEMNGEFDGQQPPEMNGEFDGQQPPEWNGEFDGQQPPERKDRFDAQHHPEMGGDRKDPLTEAIDAMEDGDLKAFLLALAENLEEAKQAEMAAHEAGEEELSAYEEAVQKAQEAMIAACKEAGIVWKEEKAPDGPKTDGEPGFDRPSEESSVK